MAQTTTNYGLLKPESTDSYNHLIYDNPNMDTIDAAMKANADAAVTSATCIKSGTTHTITRANTSSPVLRFTATGDWNSGDTMIVDGVTVTPYLANGDALINKAFLINTEVLMSVTGLRATVYTNANIASNIEYTAGITVDDALDAALTAAGTEYTAGVSVKDKLDTIGNVTHTGSNRALEFGTFDITYSGNTIPVTGIKVTTLDNSRFVIVGSVLSGSQQGGNTFIYNSWQDTVIRLTP